MLPNHWGPGGKPGKLFDVASVTHLHHKQEACPYSLSLVVFFLQRNLPHTSHFHSHFHICLHCLRLYECLFRCIRYSKITLKGL